MRSEAFSIVPHFSQANFNKRTKSKPFSLRQIAATHNALKSDFEARLTYDVIDQFAHDITMPIVLFLLQIVVNVPHLNQW